MNISMKEKHKTWEFQETMKLDADNNTKNKKMHMETNIRSYWCFIFWRNKYFPQDFLDLYKNNTNQPQFLSSGVRLVPKQMAMEQVLYAHVVMIRQKDSDNKK